MSGLPPAAPASPSRVPLTRYKPLPSPPPASGHPIFFQAHPVAASVLPVGGKGSAQSFAPPPSTPDSGGARAKPHLQGDRIWG